MSQPTVTTGTRYLTGRFHEDGTFEPHPKSRSFATAEQARAWCDDEIGRGREWSVYRVTEIPADATGRGEPTNAMPEGENAGPVRWDGEHWRQDVRTDAGVWIGAIVD